MSYPLCRNDNRLCRALADRKISQATGYDLVVRCVACHRPKSQCKDFWCEANHRKPYAGPITFKPKPLDSILPPVRQQSTAADWTWHWSSMCASAACIEVPGLHIDWNLGERCREILSGPESERRYRSQLRRDMARAYA